MSERRKYRISLRLYFALVCIITLCAACVLSTGVVVGGMLLFYRGEFTVGIVCVICLAVCTLTMLSGGIALYFGTSFFVRPLEEITGAARRIAKGDFDVSLIRDCRLRKDAEYTHELDELVANVNLMAAELSGMDHMRKDFVSNVSHEMRTPVSSMMGFAEMLLEDDLTDAEQKEYLTFIYDEASRASRLCENMLRMSRLENQALVTRHEQVMADEQIRRSVILLSERYPDREREYDLSLPRMSINGDPDLLQEVWINLLDNAIKYSPQGSCIHVSGRFTEGGIEVSVRDEGIGIPADKIPHIFEAFYQGEESHRTEGSGLGLAIVKRILDLIGGEIACSSEEDAGTVMTVTIPSGDSCI